MRTSPVEGTYEDTEELSSIRHVDIEIEREGLRMVGIKAGNRPVSGAVKIPSASTVRDGNISRCGHLERINSLLEVFLTGVQTEEEDVIQSTRYLVDPETHFHSRISERCLNQLAIDDHVGVIQAAGTALEAHLKEKAPPALVDRAQNTTDLVNQAFRGNDPPFRWGYTSGEQEGIHQLYAGAIKAFRNPTSHDRGNPDRDRYLDDINERDALDALCLFNFLIRRLETYDSVDLEYEDQ